MYVEVSRRRWGFPAGLGESVLRDVCVLAQIKSARESVERYLHPFVFSQTGNQMLAWCLSTLEDRIKLTKALICMI